jgi:hypothetical protein
MWVRTSRFAAASLPVTRPIRRGKLGREEPFGCERALQPLECREVRAETEALDREDLEPQVAALRVQLCASEDVYPLAFAQVELECVELSARHLCGQARTVLRVLERKEHRRPTRLAPELRDLAFDPQCR